MTYLSFKEQLKDFISFSLADIRKIDAGFDLRRLSEWRGKGYIKMIRRGHYVFSDLKINESVLFLMANRIYVPSYVSMEIALAHYNLIPEAVYGITSISSRKTNRFVTSFGEFTYHHIKPQLMFGYQLVSFRGHTCRIAEPEKAILDYFYLNSHLNTKDDFAGLRINGEEFKDQTNLDTLESYLVAFGNKRLEKRFQNFLKFINHD